MKRMIPSIVPWLFLALAVLFSCSTGEQAGTGPRRSLKGFEIYSWQEKGEWCFSLLIGTNRMKTFEEVTAEKTTLHGFEALKEQLGGLAKGEFVTWSPAAFPGLAMPAEDRVGEIRALCEKNGLKALF